MVYELEANKEGHTLAAVLMHTDVWGFELLNATLDNGVYTLSFDNVIPSEELEHLGLTEV